MRTTWKGSMNLALLSLPVKLRNAVGDNDLPLHQHAPDGSRIRYRRVAESTGEEVAYSDIRKGYEAPDGRVVMLEDEDFEAAYGKISRQAEILMFTSAGNVPDIAKSKPMYVEPDKGGEKSYALLARTLAGTGKVAIVMLGIGQRKRLASLSPAGGGYLMLEMLEWAGDIREPGFDAPDLTFTEAEEKMAVTLVETMSGDFVHADHHDDSQEKLNELISRRIETGDTSGAPAPAPQASGETAAADLISVLQASIEEIKDAKSKAAKSKAA